MFLNHYKNGVLQLFVLSGVLLCSPADAGKISLTTYYSSPNAVFDRLRLIPQDQLDPPLNSGINCASGGLAVLKSSGVIYFCRDNGTNQMKGDWSPLSGVWVQESDKDGDYVYPPLSINDHDIQVGVGTNSPDFRLTLEQDGGILAHGEVGKGVVMPQISAQGLTALAWYPRKAAFRAGLVSNDSFADVNIGVNSVAFGIDSKATGFATVVIGGLENIATGDYSIILNSSITEASGQHGSIANGWYSRIKKDAEYSRLIGMRSTATAKYATIGGDCGAASHDGITIAGGYANNVITGPLGIGEEFPDPFCVVNPRSGRYSTIGLGFEADAEGDYSVIGSGGANLITPNGTYSTILGGTANLIDASGATIRGLHTQIKAPYTTAAGSQFAKFDISSDYSTLGFGLANEISAPYITVVGGMAYQRLNGQAGTQVGGHASHVNNNVGKNDTSGIATVMAGGQYNYSEGDYSWAGGRHTTISLDADRSFAWSYNGNNPELDYFVNDDVFTIGFVPPDNDGKPVDPKISVGIRDVRPDGILEINRLEYFDNGEYLMISKTTKKSDAGDVFIIARNGALARVGIGNNNPKYPLHFGKQAGDAYIDTDGSFHSLSSREAKQNIKNISSRTAQRILRDLKPVTFNFKVEQEDSTVGFIAEDVPHDVAAPGRKGLQALPIAAVLTAVAKDHEDRLTQDDHVLDNALKELKELNQQLTTRSSVKLD